MTERLEQPLPKEQQSPPRSFAAYLEQLDNGTFDQRIRLGQDVIENLKLTRKISEIESTQLINETFRRGELLAAVKNEREVSVGLRTIVGLTSPENRSEIVKNVEKRLVPEVRAQERINDLKSLSNELPTETSPRYQAANFVNYAEKLRSSRLQNTILNIEQEIVEDAMSDKLSKSQLLDLQESLFEKKILVKQLDRLNDEIGSRSYIYNLIQRDGIDYVNKNNIYRDISTFVSNQYPQIDTSSVALEGTALINSVSNGEISRYDFGLLINAVINDNNKFAEEELLMSNNTLAINFYTRIKELRESRNDLNVLFFENESRLLEQGNGIRIFSRVQRVAIYKALVLASTEEEIKDVLDRIEKLPEEVLINISEKDRLRLDALAVQRELQFKNILSQIGTESLETESNKDISGILAQINELPNETEEDRDIRSSLKRRTRRYIGERIYLDIATKFTSEPASVILDKINALPDDSEEDTAFRDQIFNQYREFLKIRGVNRPDDYELVFGEAPELPESRYFEENLGINEQAFRYVKKNYRQFVQPLIETLRSDPATAPEMDAIVPRNTLANSPGLKFRRRVRDLKQQRDLTDIEEEYYRSTELLTAISPYLVAAARADIGTTSVYLQNHFSTLSRRTLNSIQDGAYYPQIHVGTGPNGMIAIGETVRKRPDIASEMLVIDAGEQPGGPFAVPNGPAWELNSANQVGMKMLPDMPGENERETVRAYGSSDRWYPGERSIQRRATRAGSINKLVDWLPDPDDLSNKRYPTNEELQVMLALQAAVCVRNIALETTVMKVEPDPEGGAESKLVTIGYTDANGEVKTARVKTDKLIVSTGLGEPSYGFELNGKAASGVLEAVKEQKGLKKVSTTLEAFRAIADRTREKPTEGIGDAIAIYGIGNSTDVLLEYFGRLFESGNQDINKVKKLYVIADGAPTKRPRYARNDDLRPRLGRENLVSPISDRVMDFDFTDDTRQLPLEQRKLKLFNRNNERITDEDGTPIEVDNIIAATGFTSNLENIFAAYLPNGQRISESVSSVILPTNDEVSVAASLSEDPSVIFVGTASNPRFNDAKLTQLPELARNALETVGAQNAVAIGFRGPDTQAATRIFLTQQEFTSLSQNETKKGEYFPGLTTVSNSVRVQDNADGKRLLAALFSYQLQNWNIVEDDGSPTTGDIEFIPRIGSDGDNVSIKKGSTDNVLQGLLELQLKNPYIKSYVENELRKVRRGKEISVNLGIKDGKVDPASTFVE